MKKLLSLLTLALFVTSISIASFPVKTEKQSETQIKTTIVNNLKSDNNSVVKMAEKSQTQKSFNSNASSKKSSKDDLVVLLLLWFFLGGLAAHRWYAGKPAGWNILFILTAGGCGIWAIIDLINIITGKF